MRISRPAPTSSASVSAVCAIVTPRSSRRSPRPALLFGPALFSTCIGSSREARSAGTSPASPAARIAAPSPQASTGQPVVTASSRGMACPPISLNSLTTPNAQAHAEHAAQQRQQQTLRRHLPEERRPAHPERAAHGVLLLPLQPAHQQQGGDVAARDQQHQRRPRLTAAAGCGGRRDSFRRSAIRSLRREAFEVVLGLRLPRGDQLEFRLRLLRA